MEEYYITEKDLVLSMRMNKTYRESTSLGESNYWILEARKNGHRLTRLYDYPATMAILNLPLFIKIDPLP